MASALATPLERQFGRIAGVNEMTSVSQLGSNKVILQFDLNRDIKGAARDVEAAINAAGAYLPSNLPSNPWYHKVNPADSPILILALTSDRLTQDQIEDVADFVVAQKLSQILGIGQVFIGGSSQPAVRIAANPPFSENGFGPSGDTGCCRRRELQSCQRRVAEPYSPLSDHPTTISSKGQKTSVR